MKTFMRQKRHTPRRNGQALFVRLDTNNALGVALLCGVEDDATPAAAEVENRLSVQRSGKIDQALEHICLVLSLQPAFGAGLPVEQAEDVTIISFGASFDFLRQLVFHAESIRLVSKDEMRFVGGFIAKREPMLAA